jgi:ribonuclease PH
MIAWLAWTAAHTGPLPAQQQAQAMQVPSALYVSVFLLAAGNKEKEYEMIIREALEALIQKGLFPRTSIMVVLQVILQA